MSELDRREREREAWGGEWWKRHMIREETARERGEMSERVR